MNRWRLLITDPRTGGYNMALDEAISAACGRGYAPPTLRFYGWNPPALSVGYFQKVRNERIVERCREKGIDLVRRPTGGKAVLHTGDLTYSVSAPSKDPRFPPDLNGAYRVIAAGFIAGLERVGVTASIFENLPSSDRSLTPSPENPSCFAAPFGHEIAVQGRKLIGSAQRRWRDRFLQHGSILCGGPCGGPSGHPAFSDELFGDVEDDSITLREILGRDLPREELIQALCEGFRESLKIDLQPGDLLPGEIHLARELKEKKYGTDEWNYRR